jgi:hypothetical protein
MAEGGMTQIMSQGDGFGEELVCTHKTCEATRNLRDFDHMVEASAEMLVSRMDDRLDLGLVLQRAKGFAVDDAVFVDLVARSRRCRRRM